MALFCSDQITLVLYMFLAFSVHLLRWYLPYLGGFNKPCYPPITQQEEGHDALKKRGDIINPNIAMRSYTT